MSNALDDGPVVDDVVVAQLLTLRDQVARPGEDVLGELLALFERDTRARLDAIHAAISEANPQGWRDAAHALKGSAGNVGARRVAVLAASVEKSPTGPIDITALEREVARALEALRMRLR